MSRTTSHGGPSGPAHPKRRGALALAATLFASLALIPSGVAPAQAAPDGSGVVISEVYARGGSANQPFTHKFVELYNPTAAAVDLAGHSIQYRSAGGSGSSNNTVALSGSIAAGGHYLIQGGSNSDNGAPLPEPDATSGGLNLSGASGTVALVSSTSAIALPTGDVTQAADPRIIDLVGYGSTNTYEGGGPIATSGGNSVPQSLTRDAEGTDTDDNASDFTAVATPTPTNSAGAGGGDDEGEGENPGGEVPETDTHSIAQIQGTGASTPLAGQTVTTSGVVTAVYASGGFNGYYLQTAGSGGDTDLSLREASDGVFIYADTAARAAQVSLGDHVRVTGQATEFNGLTQVNISSGAHEVLDEPAAPPLPIVDFEAPASDEAREVFEGMLVLPKADAYVVSDTYNLGGWGSTAYGSIGLGLHGPLLQESDVAAPGTPAFAAAVAENAARAITLDDGNSQQTSTSAQVPYLTGNPDIRTGASLTFDQPVVLDYRFQWNFQPTVPVTGAASWLRATGGETQSANSAPAEVGGDIRLATFNVLNYFTKLGADVAGCQSYKDRAGNPLSVSGGCSPRGAWNAANLDRQEAKIVAAINGLHADVVVLEEIENSAKMPGRSHQDEALQDLVAALNANAGAGTWSYVPWPSRAPSLGDQDVIRNAVIYRTATVDTAGEAGILVGSSAFHNAREPFAAVLAPTSNPDYSFVVVANHFKSKGGSCGTPAPVEGCFNSDRELQAAALTAFAEGYATSNGAEDIFLVGDFNAYSKESPIGVIETAGYENLTARSGKHSYVFNGKFGSLDHIFGNESAAQRVTGAEVWQINANESVLSEYSRYNYFASEHFQPGTVFRASDHNPGIIGIDVPAAQEGSGPAVNAVLSDRSLSLSATAVEHGLDRIEYRIDGGDWLSYEEPLHFDGLGHRVEARAIDLRGALGPVSVIIVAATAAEGALELQSLSGDREVAQGARLSGLGVRLIDGAQAPVADQVVHFTLTGEAAFLDGGNSAQVRTNAAGIAVAPALVAENAGSAQLVAHHGEYSAVVSNITVAAPAALGASVEVSFAKAANRVVLEVAVTNTNDAPVELQLRTRYGTKTFSSVDAGQLARHQFRMMLPSVPAGEVEITVIDADGKRSLLTEAYASATAAELP